MDIEFVIRDITERLQIAKIDFAFTGGIAAIYWGNPRTTEDIDIVLNISSEETANKIAEAFSPDYLIDKEALQIAIRQGDMAQAFHQEQFIKVDLHFGGLIPGEFERIQHVQIVEGLTSPLLSREDAILSKLLWIQLGSHRSKRDAVAMLRNSASLKRAFIEEMAAQLGVIEILKEVDLLARGESEERP